MRKITFPGMLSISLCSFFSALTAVAAQDPWTHDLTPISRPDWNAALAAHLLERAGFCGTPDDIARYTAMGP